MAILRNSFFLSKFGTNSFCFALFQSIGLKLLLTILNVLQAYGNPQKIILSTYTTDYLFLFYPLSISHLKVAFVNARHILLYYSKTSSIYLRLRLPLPHVHLGFRSELRLYMLLSFIQSR